MTNRHDGSVLLLVMFAVVVLAGITLAIVSLSLTYHRASSESMDTTFAQRATESGVAYYLTQLTLDPAYFIDNPAPHDPLSIGSETFELVSATPGASAGQWDILMSGTRGLVSSRLRAVLGYRQLDLPMGVALSGTGDPEEVILDINGDCTLGSYDSTTGPFIPANPGDNAAVWLNGSAHLGGGADLYGDITATGIVDIDGGAQVHGTTVENGPPPPIQAAEMESLAGSMIEESETSNDNNTLAAIFGNNWNPVPGESYGDLIVSGGNYVVPAGTYRFRRLKIRGGANVTFETSTGPSTIVFLGTGGNGPGNNLSVGPNSTVRVDSGGSDNPLRTVLAENTGFSVSSGSEFGQEQGNPNSAAYSQILSAGGTGSVELSSHSKVYGILGAPSYTLSIEGGSSWFGSAMVQRLNLSGSGGETPQFGVDESTQGTVLTDPMNFEVYARWAEIYPE